VLFISFDFLAGLKVLALLLPVGAAAAWLQADLIPDSAWAQYPIVILFIGTFVILTRYHLLEQEKWRHQYRELIEVLRGERAESQRTLEQSLKSQREAQVELIKMLQVGSREFFEEFSRVQVEAFEEAIEKISGSYYRLMHEKEEKR
jgi:hypothetical protein